MRQVVTALAAGAAIGLAAPVAAVTLPDRLVVFGDSLVDAGNAFLGTGGQTAQPGYGYFNGRFSNGPVYTDLVNARLTAHATGSFTNYTVPYLLGGDNVAVGGAQAAGDRTIGPFTVPGLATQLGLYATTRVVDPNALYVLNFGNNDVSALAAGIAAAPSPAAAAAFAQQYTAAFVGTYVGAVNYLNAHGATRFLIGGVPNPDNPLGVGLEQALQTGFAAGLHLTPGTSFTQIDFFTFFNNLRSDPTRFDLPADLDFTHVCVVTGSTPGVAVPPPPSNPRPDCSHFFSFDGVHPTAPVQAALARYVDGLIGVPLAAGSVPEPAAWSLMIAGFGLVGTAVRRRRQIA